MKRPSRLKRTGAAWALAACAVLWSSASADVIDLTTGERIRGTIKRATAAGVVIEVGGREITIEQRRIFGIVFDPAPAPRPASKPAPEAAGPAATAPSRPGPATAEPAPESEEAAAAPAEPEPATPESAAEPSNSAAAPAEPERADSGPAPPPSRPAEEAPPAVASVEAEPPAVAPRPALVVFSLSPRTLRDALRALVDLRALAEASVNRPDYAAQTNEAKAQVERYVNDPEDGRAEVKSALGAAMRLYALASTAWSVFDARGDLAAVGRDPAIAECARLRQVIEHDAASWSFKADDPAFAGLITGTEGIPDLWACASDKIGEAETLLTRQE